MNHKPASWIHIASNVKFTIQLPKLVKFVADVYECSNCHNKTNNSKGLPAVCPWCDADMRGGTG